MPGQPKPGPAGPGPGADASRPGAVEEDGETAGRAGGGRRRGPRHEGQRRRRITFRLHDGEAAALAGAARRAGLTVAGYAASAALAAAAGMPSPRPVTSDRELASRAAVLALNRARAELRHVGVNVNQLAKVANTTGVLPAGLAAVIADVERAVDAVDRAVTDLA
jgi:Bacterial mobilisation protein (MobC)